MEVPKFLKLENDSLLFNEDNKELIFYVPEKFFNDNTKRPIAEQYGEQISMIGICNYSIIDSNGKSSEVKPFIFPTMMLCEPYNIEKVKKYKLPNSIEEDDYRFLHFKKGDKVVSQVRVPELIDNAEMFFKLMIITAKIPNTIPYSKLWELFIENGKLSGINYDIIAQLFGIIIRGICRDPKDINQPYVYSKSTDENNYKLIPINYLPNYVSPFTSITSNYFDESLRSAILMSDKDEKDIPYSPLEKILMQ